MNHLKEIMLSAAITEYIAEQENVAPRHLKVSHAGLRLEELLTATWFDQGSPDKLSLKQRELAFQLSLSSESIRKACLTLMISGRWEIIPGTGRTETTFAPLFIEAIKIQGEK